jgi:hypothetical protein
LPAIFAAEKIRELETANGLLDQLLIHANTHELHREIGTTPKTAWDQARQEKRSVLRPAPKCPWWPYVFSQQTPVRVGDDGKVPIGQERCSINAAPRATVIRCLRPDGDIFSFWARHPIQKVSPLSYCISPFSDQCLLLIAQSCLLLIARKILLLNVTRQ